MKIRIALFATLLIVYAQCLAQEPAKDPPKEWRDFFGTSFSADDCVPADPVTDPGARICKGIHGYSLLTKGDEFKPEIYLVTPNRKRFRLQYWNTSDPKYQGLNPGASWIVVHSPKTITLTFFLRITQRDDYTYSDHYDTIVRVNPGPVCVIGSVPAGSTSAGESVAIASSPKGRRCLALHEREKKDWFLTGRRLANEGEIRAAKLAVTRIHTPSERFLVYREIAVAQFRAGDLKGARSTLMRARAEALRNRFREEPRSTLGYIISGMTESGLYEDAKADIKRLPEADRLDTFLTIAYIQADKGDLEAAKKTFQEAIQVELKRNPPLDGNLSKISQAQGRSGLDDEAGKTASLIRDPEFRKTVQQIISERRRK